MWWDRTESGEGIGDVKELSHGFLLEYQTGEQSGRRRRSGGCMDGLRRVVGQRRLREMGMVCKEVYSG
jgi:hypothetical protein